MLIKILNKNEDGFITAYKDISEDFELHEIQVDTGKKDENGDTVFVSVTKEVYFKEDGVEIFMIPQEQENHFINNCENFKIYRKKLKYYEPEINVPTDMRFLKEQLFSLIIKRDALEKEGIDVAEYNFEIEILKTKIKEQPET